MSEARPLQCSCVWVPGTLDHVRSVPGRAAVQDLYVLGRCALPATDVQLLHLLDQLGCPSAARGAPSSLSVRRAASAHGVKEPLSLE